jgi:ATP-dependent DNA helicase RecG
VRSYFQCYYPQDYTGVAIQLSVYNDKLILWNEGILPEGWNIKRLREKHPSKPTNKNIAATFFKAGFIEAWRRGIAKIKRMDLSYLV